MTDRMRNLIMIAVTIVWVINFVLGAIPAVHYEQVDAINGIFMAIVGGVFLLAKGPQAPPPPPTPPPVTPPTSPPLDKKGEE